jgi:cell division protease FtsH
MINFVRHPAVFIPHGFVALTTPIRKIDQVIQFLRHQSTIAQSGSKKALKQSIGKSKIVSAPLNDKKNESQKALFCDDSDWQLSIPKENFSSIGGYARVVDKVKDFMQYIQDPKIFEQLDLRAPKRLILSGPTGVGKTLLVKAMAGHCNVPLLRISGAEFNCSPHGEAKFKALLKKIHALGPCVLCIDQIELLGQENDQSKMPMVNQLFYLLAKDCPGAVVVGMTAQKEMLNPDFYSRFDRHLSFGLPRLDDRVSILKIHTKKKTLQPAVSLTDIALMTENFTGKQLANLVNEAALLALTTNSKKISEKHFDDALTFIQRGVVYQAHTTEEQKHYTAAHEAGHALIGHLLGFKIYKISLLGDEETLGYTETMPTYKRNNCTRQGVLDQICVYCAGRAAELIIGQPSMGCKEDFDKARQFANSLVDEEMGLTIDEADQDVEEILYQQMQRAHALLEENEDVWRKLTNVLVKKDQLLRKDFLKIVSGNLKPLKESVSQQLESGKIDLSKKFPHVHNEATQSLNLPIADIQEIKKSARGRYTIIFRTPKE